MFLFILTLHGTFSQGQALSTQVSVLKSVTQARASKGRGGGSNHLICQEKWKFVLIRHLRQPYIITNRRNPLIFEPNPPPLPSTSPIPKIVRPSRVWRQRLTADASVGLDLKQWFFLIDNKIMETQTIA